MKRFSEFLKEEIDLRGNTGIPDDFMRNSDRQAERNLGVRVDDERQMMGRDGLGSQIMGLIQQSGQIMMGNGRLNPTQLEERWVKLEELAKNIVLDEFNDILEASEKPVELLIKLIRPWLRQSVVGEMPEMGDLEASAPDEVIRDNELKKSVDKKKLLNAINQGYAKSTKNIIQASTRVRPALAEIFGADADRIYNLWLQTTEVANKMDWVIPIEAKGEMMKNAPQGMAGACQVKWEKEEDKDKEEQEEKEFKLEDETQDETQDQPQSEEEMDDFTKIVIKAVGVDFPMLLHEAIKGIFQLLQSGAIKDDEELAKLIAKNTESFEDESQDFRYGPVAQKMLREFVLSCRDCDRYTNMDARIYAKLALDKDRGGELTDGEFLEVTKSIFACFDLVSTDTLEFTMNMEKFGTSTAKTKIERMISDIVAAEREYEAELAKWEMEDQFSKNDNDYKEEDDDVSDDDDKDFKSFLSDHDISGAKDKEEKVNKSDIEDADLKNSDGDVISQNKLRDLIDDALDAGDYDEARRIGKYIKEGKQIYLREADRIEEYKKYRRK